MSFSEHEAFDHPVACKSFKLVRTLCSLFSYLLIRLNCFVPFCYWDDRFLFKFILQAFWLYPRRMNSLLTDLLTYLTQTNCLLFLMMVRWTQKFWSIIYWCMIIKMTVQQRCILVLSFLVMLETIIWWCVTLY